MIKLSEEGLLKTEIDWVLTQQPSCEAKGKFLKEFENDILVNSWMIRKQTSLIADNGEGFGICMDQPATAFP